MRKILLIHFLCFFSGLHAQDLFQSVKQNDLKAVREYEGAVNLRDNNKATPLMWAIYADGKRMTRVLIGKGADPTMKGWIIYNDTLQDYQFIYGSCMATAAGKGKIRIVKYLIRKHNIPVDDREINLYNNRENGWTALHWAAVTGNVKLAKYLLRKGADINAKAYSNFNQSPLLFAISFGHADMVELLLEAGADVNQTDSYGISPLSYAFDLPSRYMVKFLIEKNAQFGPKEYRTVSDMLSIVFDVESASEL